MEEKTAEKVSQWGGTTIDFTPVSVDPDANTQFRIREKNSYGDIIYDPADEDKEDIPAVFYYYDFTSKWHMEKVASYRADGRRKTKPLKSRPVVDAEGYKRCLVRYNSVTYTVEGNKTIILNKGAGPNRRVFSVSMESDFDLDLTDGVKILKEDGWVIIRPSGTEPIFRCFSESDSQEKADEMTEWGLGLIEKYKK